MQIVIKTHKNGRRSVSVSLAPFVAPPGYRAFRDGDMIRLVRTEAAPHVRPKYIPRAA